MDQKVQNLFLYDENTQTEKQIVSIYIAVCFIVNNTNMNLNAEEQPEILTMCGSQQVDRRKEEAFASAFL